MIEIGQHELLNSITLKNLDDTWHHLPIKKNVLGRVLSVSKCKFLLSKNHMVKMITNLLISDGTAITRVTCFDDIGLIINNTIKENDVIFLNGSYRTSMYKPKSSAYVLKPKKDLNLPETQIELKLNESDIQHIKLVSNIVPNIPKALWSFRSIQLLNSGRFIHHRSTDFIGVMLHLGRMEREPIFNSCGKESGRYWCRNWIALGDPSTSTLVYVKLYSNNILREVLFDCIPGRVM